MQNKILVGGVVAVVLYLVATRTCAGKKLVARLRGRELADCGCTDCGSHATPATPANAPAASSASVTLNLGGKDAGCDDCGGAGGITAAQPTARTAAELGIRRAVLGRPELELRDHPAPLPVKEPPAQRVPVERAAWSLRTAPPVPVPVPEQQTLALIGGNVPGAGKGGR